MWFVDGAYVYNPLLTVVFDSKYSIEYAPHSLIPTEDSRRVREASCGPAMQNRSLLSRQLVVRVVAAVAPAARGGGLAEWVAHRSVAVEQLDAPAVGLAGEPSADAADGDE